MLNRFILLKKAIKVTNQKYFFIKIKKYIFSYIINKIKNLIDIKIKNAIKIQSYIRMFIMYKKINILKSVMNIDAITIQKFFRGFLIRKKNKEEIDNIIKTINFNKKKKDYEEKMKIMKKKKAAVRVIEKWWNKILEAREQKEIEEQVKKMPIECQDLYKKFISLRNQTKTIKSEFHDFKKKEAKKKEDYGLQIS